MLILTFGRIAENSALEAEWTTLPLTKGRGFEPKGRILVESGVRLAFGEIFP